MLSPFTLSQEHCVLCCSRARYHSSLHMAAGLKAGRRGRAWRTQDRVRGWGPKIIQDVALNEKLRGGILFYTPSTVRRFRTCTSREPGPWNKRKPTWNWSRRSGSGRPSRGADFVILSISTGGLDATAMYLENLWLVSGQIPESCSRLRGSICRSSSNSARSGFVSARQHVSLRSGAGLWGLLSLCLRPAGRLCSGLLPGCGRPRRVGRAGCRGCLWSVRWLGRCRDTGRLAP